jgi:CHAD domain-containing protein
MDQIDVNQSAAALTMPPGSRLHEYATTQLARAIACLAWRGARLHTGVHQARKSLRRVRATLALGGSALGPGAALVDRELRRINRSLSKLRDAHALVAALDEIIATQADDDDATPVLRRIRRTAARARAVHAREALADDPQLQDKRALLTTLLAALPGLKWDAIATADAGAALQSSLIQAETAAAKARAGNDDADWHRWRRRARRVSQQQRALGDALAHRPTGKNDKRLAVLLGKAQDHAMLCEHCGRKSIFVKVDRQVLRALAESRMQHLRQRLTTAEAATTMAPTT